MGRSKAGLSAAAFGMTPLALFFLSACTVAKPGTEFRYYPVFANSPADLARSIHSYAPRSGRAYGLTEITFVPAFELSGEGHQCRAKNVSVDLALEITLPKWRDGKGLSKSVRSRFHRFERYVRAHELHHAGIAKAYARKAESKIAVMRSTKGCGDLRRRIALYLMQMKLQHLASHKAYDVREKDRLKRLLP